MNDHAHDPAARKKEKKHKRIMKKSAYALGAGVGFLILKILVVPLLGEDDLADQVLSAFVWALFLYGALVALTFIFKREWVAKADFILSWFILPAILIRLVLDIL